MPPLINITPAQEKQLWSALEPKAVSAFAFWNTFLGLRDAANGPLSTADAAKWLRVIRAVSLVESRHGSGGGNQPARDPMQCGNPLDIWWRELTKQTAQFDVLQRGAGLSPASISADKLAAKAAAEATFPAAAKLSTLTKEKDGHKDANFTAVMSFHWAIPLLIHKTNTKAGAKTFQCADSSEARLVAGAVAYNGGGDPNYGAKIKEALTIIDAPAVAITPHAAAESIDAEALPETAPIDVRQIFASLLDTVRSERTVNSVTLFPHGVTDIELSAEAAGVKVSFKISGPPS